LAVQSRQRVAGRAAVAGWVEAQAMVAEVRSRPAAQVAVVAVAAVGWAVADWAAAV
jgi:hypothetical protein